MKDFAGDGTAGEKLVDILMQNNEGPKDNN
jgi:hypothetical protein